MKIKFVMLTALFIALSYADSFSIYSESSYTMNVTAEKTIRITCTEMSCKACKQSITKAINKLEGIVSLEINLESKVISVVIDESKTDEQSVLNAIIGAGYDAELTK